MSVHRLAAALSVPESAPAVLDVRWRLGGPPGRLAFERGHVPGSQYVDLDSDLADPPSRAGRHPLPDPDRFAAAMRALGVRADRPVVALDDSGGVAAARLWWLLRHHGHDRVHVLDGGYPAWTAAGGPVDTGPAPPPQPGDFVAAPGRMPLLGAAQAAELARDGVLLDARAGGRYRGEQEPVDPVAGHVPGARSLPASETVDAAGHLRAPAELAELFGRAGVDRQRPVGAYCGSGVTSAHTVLALATAGIDAALYPGSWSEWVTDPARPVATGADPG